MHPEIVIGVEFEAIEIEVESMEMLPDTMRAPKLMIERETCFIVKSPSIVNL